MKKSILFLGILFTTATSFSQSQDDFEKFSSVPKTIKTFPVNYKILLPRLEHKSWDQDFDRFYDYLNPALMKTQQTLRFTNAGVNTMINYNSILPHAQLDTSTIIKNLDVLNGVWRVISFRKIRFIDSVDIKKKQYYRNDTLLADNSADEAFVVFNDNNFQLLVKEEGKKKFKKKGSSNYAVENRRYLMLYKLFRAGSGVSQIGIDEEGHLILNYPAVIEHVKQNEYISYYAIIEQYILEKIKQ